MKTLILGYGNRNRRDDGAGWYVVEQLQRDGADGAELATAHQLDFEHAETISHFDQVIFVDAAVPALARPVQRSEVKPNYHPHAVSHYLTPADVLAMCSTLYGSEPRAVLFSLRGADFGFGDKLTPDVRRVADDVVTEIRQMLFPAVAHA